MLSFWYLVLTTLQGVLELYWFTLTNLVKENYCNMKYLHCICCHLLFGVNYNVALTTFIVSIRKKNMLIMLHEQSRTLNQELVKWGLITFCWSLISYLHTSSRNDKQSLYHVNDSTTFEYSTSKWRFRLRFAVGDQWCWKCTWWCSKVRRWLWVPHPFLCFSRKPFYGCCS